MLVGLAAGDQMGRLIRMAVRRGESLLACPRQRRIEESGPLVG
jgi:hypothetical protein